MGSHDRLFGVANRGVGWMCKNSDLILSIGKSFISSLKPLHQLCGLPNCLFSRCYGHVPQGCSCQDMKPTSL